LSCRQERSSGGSVRPTDAVRQVERDGIGIVPP
jgi:hypothetical protein